MYLHSHKHYHNKKQQVALSSIFAGVGLTTMKLIVGLLTGSLGIISEAAHSALDLAAAILTYFAVKIGDQPADESHPYGHAKFESVSALIETGLLFLTSFWIIYESIKRLITHDTEVHATWYAFAIVIIAITVDIIRSRIEYRVARETHSQALEADALHYSSDIYSSAAVLLGLILVAFGIKGADSIAALVVAVFIMVAGYRLGKRTIDVLVDTAPKGVKEIVDEITLKNKDKYLVDYVRVRSLGSSVLIDLGIKIGRKTALENVDKLVEDLKQEIKTKLPEAETTVHIKSVTSSDETIIETINVLATRQNLSVHDIICDNVDGKKFISYDLEVPENLTIEEAHKLASALEITIKRELGQEIELSSHMEPNYPDIAKSQNIDQAEIEKIKQQITEAAKQFNLIINVHNILIRKIDNQLFITLHYAVLKNTTIKQAHSLASKLEYLIKQKINNVRRVVVHEEPGN